MNKKEEWYRRTTGGDSFNKVGRKSGRDPSAISKAAAKGWKLSAETVIAIARAYHADPLVGLVVFDKLTERETQKMTADQTLKTIPARRLADELVARVSRYQENQTKPATQEPAEKPV